MDSIDTNNTYKDPENNNIYLHEDINYVMEEFIFIFDFTTLHILLTKILISTTTHFRKRTVITIIISIRAISFMNTLKL